MERQLKKRLLQFGLNNVDASHLISKANLWEERDEVRKQKYEKLNNETLPEVAHDKQAKIGCKGGGKLRSILV